MKLSFALPYAFSLPELSTNYNYGQLRNQYYIVPMQSLHRSEPRTLPRIDRSFRSSMEALRSELFDPVHIMDPFEMDIVAYRQPYLMRRNKNNLADEINESLDNFKININIPKGMKANDISLELMRNGEILRLHGSYRIEKDNIVTQSQISRMFKLGKNADTSKVSAKLSDGVLQVIVPKIHRDVESANIKIDITENTEVNPEKVEIDKKDANNKAAHETESKEEQSTTELARNNNEDDFEINED